MRGGSIERSLILLCAGAFLAWPSQSRAQGTLPGPAYDCRWAAPAAPARCERVNDAAPVLVALIEASEAFKIGLHFDATRAKWLHMAATVRDARATLAPARLEFRERVVAQNVALQMALKASFYGLQRDSDARGELVREAAALIALLALPPERLRDADADAGLDAWLGPRAAWIEQRIQGDPRIFHEFVNLSTRSFRIVHAGGRRFIFSQLVAIDMEWRPHVTSVIGDIEMRRGLGRDEPACIAEFDPRLSLCDANAGLAAIGRRPIVHLGGYVRVDENGRANCLSCHLDSSGPLGLHLEPLAADTVDGYLRRHRARLIATLTDHIAPIRAALR